MFREYEIRTKGIFNGQINILIEFYLALIDF